MALKADTQLEKEQVMYNIFDTFGTHFPTLLRFGSRFGMFTQISSKESV